MLNRVSGYLQLNIGQDFLLQEFVLQDIIMPVKQYYNQDIGKICQVFREAKLLGFHLHI